MEQTKSDRAMFSAERIQESTPWFLAAVILIALIRIVGSLQSFRGRRSIVVSGAVEINLFVLLTSLAA